MSAHFNRIVDPVELPAPRNWLKRLRHFRRYAGWRSRFRVPRQLPTGRSDPACPDFAIAAIAISEKYVDWCRTMISTARGCGGYAGPIYVVTDQPNAFADDDNVFAIPVPYSRVKLISKSLKPMLFEWLPQTFIAYIDADVIVIGSIAEWYKKSRERLEAVGSPVLAYEVGVPIPESFHGGLLFAERAPAMPFFRAWRRMLSSGRYLSDQVALRRIATHTTPAYFADLDFLYLEEYFDTTNEDTLVFVHITNRMIQDFPADAMRRYLVEQLGVTRLPEHMELGDGH